MLSVRRRAKHAALPAWAGASHSRSTGDGEPDAEAVPAARVPVAPTSTRQVIEMTDLRRCRRRGDVVTDELLLHVPTACRRLPGLLVRHLTAPWRYILWQADYSWRQKSRTATAAAAAPAMAL